MRLPKTSAEIQALQHPDCATETWWRLAAKYPIEAMESVLYPLLLLEAPERWIELEERHMGQWIGDVLSRLPDRFSQLFGIDCAERVLHLYEREYSDGAAREALRLRHLLIEGKTTIEAWTAAAVKIDKGISLQPRHIAAQYAGGQ